MPIGMKEAAVLTQAQEGELRARHQRVHTYREQIAMQGGTAGVNPRLLCKPIVL
jgi:ABC-type uncharacterized transport system fused permease/ATPase subunit